MINKKIQIVTMVFLVLLLKGCAQLHHIQLGDIDNQDEFSYVPVEIHVNEFGMDIYRVSRYAKSVEKNTATNTFSSAAGTVSLFQMGPKTGLGSFEEKYADNIFYLLYEKCPSGDLTGITALRESRSYDAISGEYVTVKAYCKQKKENV